MKRKIHFAMGMSSVGLGVAGAFLPVLPSTCFFIFAAYFFSQSSERMERWVLNHEKFGPPVRQWRETRSIARPAKIAASVGMSLSLLFMLVGGAPSGVLLGGLLVLSASAIYVWTRPEIAPSPTLTESPSASQVLSK